MRDAAEKEAAAEEARIKAAAEEDARKIVESAEQEIAAAAKLARRELTAYAANLAVYLAARQIKVDASTDQALVREFAQRAFAESPAADRKGWELAHGFRDQHLRPRLRRRGLRSASGSGEDPAGGAVPCAVGGGSRELREVWEAPSIPAEQKRALLDAIVAREGISRPVRNFMAVLMDHRRIKFLEPIVKEFEQELESPDGLCRSADHERAGTRRIRNELRWKRRWQN